MGIPNKALSLNSLADLAQLGQGSTLVESINGQMNVHLTSASGMRRKRLYQMFNGLPVFGVSLHAEVDANGHFTGGLAGHVVRNVHRHLDNESLGCIQNAEEMKNITIPLGRLDLTSNNTNSDTTFLKRSVTPLILLAPSSKVLRRAYKLDIVYVLDGEIKREVYYFGACFRHKISIYSKLERNYRFHSNGRVSRKNKKYDQVDPIKSSNRLNILQEHKNDKDDEFIVNKSCPTFAVGIGGNEKMGIVNYNIPPLCLNVQNVGGNICKMEGKYTQVVNNMGTRRKHNNKVITFPCSFGYKDHANGGYGVANDAFFNGERAVRFYEEIYNLKPFDFKIRLVVHYGNDLASATWGGKEMYLGDGNAKYHPFVDADVVTHELAHGVTELNSNLQLHGMAGAINEAFSDITAIVTRVFYGYGNDWTIGRNVVKKSSGPEVMRYFDDPTKSGRSIKHVTDFNSEIGVHSASGIFNHAFYTMVEVEGMNIYEAYKCFLDANIALWYPFVTFVSGACNVLQTAYDNGFDHEKVRRAFQRVGIDLTEDNCKHSVLVSSIFPGDRREGIRISATRSPILKLEFDEPVERNLHLPTTTITILVTAEKKEFSQNIQISIGTDDLLRVENLITQGNGTCSLNIPCSHSDLYIKLESNSQSDIKARLDVIPDTN